MSQRSPFRLLGPPGLVAGLSAASVVVASASFFVITPPIDLSLPSPFADCTVGGPGTNYPNSEVEPWVAVNPTNPNTIVAVFQQDRWSNGGAHGLVAKTSHNGGASWSTSWAHFSTCSGGTAANGGDYDRASDPWVTIAPNGDVFQISLSASADLVTSAVLVSKSTDGGDTWGEPTTLIKDSSPFNFNDKESITADPTKPGYVYAVWDRSRLPSENADINALHSYAFRGDVMFARTTNGGASWEPARDVLPRNANLSTIGNQIIVLPDGTLLDVFNLLKGSGNQPHGLQTFQAVMRSTDKGMSWSSPIIISSEEAVAVIDPDNGRALRTGTGLPDIAVDQSNGSLYVVWEDSRFSGHMYNDIALSRSTDGGLTWSAPIRANTTPVAVPAFTPSVEVAADGTVAVAYYDFRNNDPTAGLPTGYWMVHSHDYGLTFDAESLITLFDEEKAPFARGYFLGDYVGLTTAGNLFLTVFITTETDANPTDAFVVYAEP